MKGTATELHRNRPGFLCPFLEGGATMELVKRRKTRLPVGFIVLCVVPTVTLSVMFTLVPIINGLYMSLTNAASMRMTSNVRFIGLENYIYMFTRDKRFLTVLWNTLRLMIVVPPCTIFLSLFLAVLLTQSRLRERGLYRVLLFMPSIVSLTVVAVVWACVYDPRSAGVVNTIIGLWGAGPVAWLGDDRFALGCIAVVMIWQAAGYYMIMHVAALDSIPASVYEAAAIDGASPVDRFFRVTVPLMKDIIGITLIFSLSGTLGLSFVLTNVMTGGGPGTATLVLGLYTYNMAFSTGATNVGYSMALSMFSLVLGALISVVSRKFSYTNENV
jgi:N-acetylglucosamine transport system permease protein